jgi:K+-sensing histidine kinase KdpD
LFKKLLNIHKKLNLKFFNLAFNDRNIEESYIRDTNTVSIGSQRIGILVAVLIYSIFGLMDFKLFSGSDLDRILIIRYLLGVPATLILLMLSYSQFFIKQWQITLSVFVVITGSTVILIIASSPPPASYYNYPGLMLILFYSFVILRIRFIYSLFTGLILIFEYMFCARIFYDLPDNHYWNNNFFFIITYFMGIFSSYMIELYKRNDYYLQNQLENEKQNMDRLLENEITLNMMKSRFLNVTSHVFRNPLTAILNSSEILSELLTRKNLDQESTFNKYIYNSANEILNILNRVQFITKYQSGELRFNPNTIGLTETINSVIEKLIKSESKSQFITIEKSYENHIIYTDKNLLDYSLTEILSNAIRYSPDNGIVRIESELTISNDLIISISDNGDGLPEDIHNKYQSSFNFIDDTAITGMGLGFVIINICMNIIDAKFSIHNNLPMGTVIQIKIKQKKPYLFNN